MKPTPGGPRGQLYHIGKDPTEADHMWLQHPEIVARLTALLENTNARDSVGRCYARGWRTKFSESFQLLLKIEDFDVKVPRT